MSLKSKGSTKKNNNLDFFIPDYFYEPKEGTLQLSVEAPTIFAFIGILQYISLGAIFIYLLYVFNSEVIASVKISSVVLDAPYDCHVLSPYSGQEVYDTSTLESTIVSKSLYTYTDCISKLKENDVCNQQMTKNNILNIFGYEVYENTQNNNNNQNCIDVPLNSIRFCYGVPNEGSSNINGSLAFTSSTNYPTYSNSYYAIINTDENNLLTNNIEPNTMHSKIFYFTSLSNYELDTNTFMSNEKNRIYVKGTTISVTPPGMISNSNNVILEIDILNNTVINKITVGAPYSLISYDIDILNDIGYIYLRIQGGTCVIISLNNFHNINNFNFTNNNFLLNAVCDSYPDNTMPIRPITIASSTISGSSNNVLYFVCGTEEITSPVIISNGPPSPPTITNYLKLNSYDINNGFLIEYNLQLSNLTSPEGPDGHTTEIDITYIYQIFTVSRSTAPAIIYMTGTPDNTVSDTNLQIYLMKVDLNSKDKTIKLISIINNKFLHHIFTSFEGSIGPPTPNPTLSPTLIPTVIPTMTPTTVTPTARPSPTPGSPTEMPSVQPTVTPTTAPPTTSTPTTSTPTVTPTVTPTATPTKTPTIAPTPAGNNLYIFIYLYIYIVIYKCFIRK